MRLLPFSAFSFCLFFLFFLPFLLSNHFPINWRKLGACKETTYPILRFQIWFCPFFSAHGTKHDSNVTEAAKPPGCIWDNTIETQGAICTIYFRWGIQWDTTMGPHGFPRKWELWSVWFDLSCSGFRHESSWPLLLMFGRSFLRFSGWWLVSANQLE